MSFAIARGNWHGISLEDLFLGIAGLVFAFVLARLFGRSLARDNGTPASLKPPMDSPGPDDPDDPNRRS
jgi:hypothetical protein